MDLLKRDVYAGGLARNRDFYGPGVDVLPEMPPYKRNILFDPQTSGGLLLAVSPSISSALVEQLHKAGIAAAAVIGRVIKQPEHRIRVR
jgi:selenide, water dikinase